MSIIRFNISDPLNKRFALPIDGLHKRFLELESAWKKKEKVILQGLYKITGLTFLQKQIDVFLVDPTTSRAISHPIIIGTKGPTSKFIRILTHELIHKLTWDNVQHVDWYPIVEKMYSKESKSTAYHVMVHAILEAVYIEVLNEPIEILNDIDMCKGMPDYDCAWKIVKKEGYKNIIAKLRSSA